MAGRKREAKGKNICVGVRWKPGNREGEISFRRKGELRGALKIIAFINGSDGH